MKYYLVNKSKKYLCVQLEDGLSLHFSVGEKKEVDKLIAGSNLLKKFLEKGLLLLDRVPQALSKDEASSNEASLEEDLNVESEGLDK